MSGVKLNLGAVVISASNHGEKMNVCEGDNGFFENTADDYELCIDVVKECYKRAETIAEFYNYLEMEVFAR